MFCRIEVFRARVAQGSEVRDHLGRFACVHYLSFCHEHDVVEEGENGGAGLMDGDDDRVSALGGQVLQVFHHSEGLVGV
jgi:hypothetical protein